MTSSSTPPTRSAPTPPLRPIASGHPHRVAGIVTVAGLLATAVGDAAPEGLDWDGPGPAIFALLALLVAVVPGRAMVLLSVLASAVFLYGALTVPDSLARIADPTAVLDLVCAIVQILGLLCAVVAGVVALAPAARWHAPDRDGLR